MVTTKRIYTGIFLYCRGRKDGKKTREEKWKPIIMIRVKYTPLRIPLVKVVEKNRPLPCPALPCPALTGLAPPHEIVPSLSLCFSFLENPSIVPVRLNFFVAFLQFDPAPTAPWSPAVVTVDNGELTIV